MTDEKCCDYKESEVKSFGCAGDEIDPRTDGYLCDICHVPIEIFVIPGGWRKLPGQPKQYTDGENSRWYTREEYMEMTKKLVGYEIDPEKALEEMREKTGKDFRLWK